MCPSPLTPGVCGGVCFQYRTQRVPELIPKPTVAQLLDETTTRRVYIYGIQDDNGTDVQNFSLDLTPPPDVIMKTSPGTSEGMNVLGIVIFSATMGERERAPPSRQLHAGAGVQSFFFFFPSPGSRNHAGKNGAQRERSGQLLPKPERGGPEDRCHRHLVRARTRGLAAVVLEPPTKPPSRPFPGPLVEHVSV